MHVDYELDISDLPQECIDDCSASGPADDAVTYWQEKLDFTVNRDRAIECLTGYGAWEPAELAAMEDGRIARIVLWLAAGNFREQRTWEERNPGKPPEDSSAGSSVFVLE